MNRNRCSCYNAVIIELHHVILIEIELWEKLLKVIDPSAQIIGTVINDKQILSSFQKKKKTPAKWARPKSWFTSNLNLTQKKIFEI